MSSPPRSLRHYNRRLFAAVAAMGAFEWFALVLTIVATVQWFYYAGINWQSIALCIAMLVTGWLAAELVYPLWFGK